MLLIAHITTGAVIGQKMSDPVVICIIAFLSHFILDRIPHWNYYVPSRYNGWALLKTIPDVLPSAIIYLTFIFSFPDQWLYITLGVVFAALPDFLTLTKFIPGLKKIFLPLNNFHLKVQGKLQEAHKRVWGLAIQAFYLALLIVIFIIF